MVEIEEFMKRIILSGNRREDDYSGYWKAESLSLFELFRGRRKDMKPGKRE
jgi:hypothetical protein